MSFEKTFCSSPWFHMRINNQGHYEYCRWASASTLVPGESIQSSAPDQYFQNHMIEIRKNLLLNQPIAGCKQCHQMERHNKISGRQRQLLKTGISTDNFDKTLLSSPWFDQLQHAHVDLLPQDWQIDLGNFCNSACVFCTPNYSSRLANEYKKLNIIDQLPANAWCDNAEYLDRFVDVLKRSPAVKYLHFIGGETLITPAFSTILKALIDSQLNHTVTIGFTTNLTVWDDEIADMLCKFHEVNLGLSIECFDRVNDYARWPSNIDSVKHTIESWLALARRQQWSVQFRTTPNLLTVSRLLTVYDYAWDHNVAVESCNFLENPECLRISVLPRAQRQQVIDGIKLWLASHNSDHHQVINTRNPEFIRSQMVQDLNSYVNYLENEIDESHLLPKCVAYLKLLESNRKNSVLDYLPEYEQLFRSAGY